MSTSEAEIALTWNKTLEQYIADVGEKCIGYSWLHKKAELMYSHRTIFLDLPTIIIGAVNGFLSVGSRQIFAGDEYASIYIGMVSLFVSLLNTISSYFSWGRRAEAHKLASNAYARLSRMINIELHTKPRSERMGAQKLLDTVKSQYDSLCENSPLVPPPITDIFNKRFGTVKDLSLPEETNGIYPIYVYEEMPHAPPTTPVFSPLPTYPHNVQIELPTIHKPSEKEPAHNVEGL